MGGRAKISTATLTAGELWFVVSRMTGSGSDIAVF